MVFLLLLLLGNVPGYRINKSLKEEIRNSIEQHFKALLLKLEQTRQQHLKDLKQLIEIKGKSKGGGNVTRIRKMKASVSPGLYNNYALQELDGGREKP